MSPVSPALAGGFFTTPPPRKPNYCGYGVIIKGSHSEEASCLWKTMSHFNQSKQTPLQRDSLMDTTFICVPTSIYPARCQSRFLTGISIVISQHQPSGGLSLTHWDRESLLLRSSHSQVSSARASEGTTAGGSHLWVGPSSVLSWPNLFRVLMEDRYGFPIFGFSWNTHSSFSCETVVLLAVFHNFST